jgi:2-isopropylmalate synthase
MSAREGVGGVGTAGGVLVTQVQRPHDTPALPPAVEIYDTTLRDGSQREGLSLTVEDKLRIAEQLDRLGVHYIEAGWPGANPKDDAVFARARSELRLEHARFVAFGATRKAGGSVDGDENLRNLLDAGTDTVCMVAKSWDYHVTEALRTSLDEAVAMVADSVEHLVGRGLTVLLDAEHFFDGYRRNPQFSLRVLRAAQEAGAARLVLCDTNGGTMPWEVERIVAAVRAELPGAGLGGHFHNDAGCAVANALAAVRQGAVQVQGCMNGYGERTGNANLCSVIPNLTLKMGVETVPRDRLALLTPVSHFIAELVNLTLDPQQPYVGTSAFTHKAGLHTSAISRASDAYEHCPPDEVGNTTRFVVSELAGRSTVQLKAEELGVALDGAQLAAVVDELKRREYEGFHFEVADASFELLLRTASGWQQSFFRLESFRVLMEKLADGGVATEATIKLWAPGADGAEERIIATAEGNGPVNALDAALRRAIGQAHPALDHLHLTDYKVRILDSHKGTGAVTRVLIDTTDGVDTWSTIGVHENIIDASWQALVDSIVTGLLRAEASAPIGGEARG